MQEYELLLNWKPVRAEIVAFRKDCHSFQNELVNVTCKNDDELLETVVVSFDSWRSANMLLNSNGLHHHHLHGCPSHIPNNYQKFDECKKIFKLNKYRLTFTLLSPVNTTSK